MNGNEFIRRVRKLGKRQDVVVELVAHRGKGSHGTLYFGPRRTTVKDRRKEIGKGLLAAMCRQLGIDPEDI